MSDLKVYVVTLKHFQDLDAFYEDMETPGGNLYIPDRIVDVYKRRPISRSTHYYLTDEEAEQLRNDPRVYAVELQSDYAGFKPTPCYTQYSDYWDKSAVTATNRVNWGLLRLYLGQQIARWGSDDVPTASGAIEINQSGYNVDVVVVDGIIDPTLSELQNSSNGTGGSRVQQYNWLQSDGEVYNYTLNPSFSNDNNHGAHVAGIVAGNSQGWARNANIYNISPYDTQILPPELIYDYIILWHRSKPINPVTGRKNPTIINNSWVFSTSVPYTTITQLVHRGSSISGPFTIADLNNYGLFPDGSGNITVSARVVNVDMSIQDCIDEGIIVVGAAGNDSALVDIPSGLDYNNRFIAPPYLYYFNRGGSPTAANNAICVGAINTVANEGKADYSNCGPRINILAPGSNIMSSVNNNSGSYSGAVADPRGSGYMIKISGTSMASPQVSGILACLMQVYPNLNQSMAIQYITEICQMDVINDPDPTSASNTLSLQNGPNRYVKYVNELVNTGNVFPQASYWLRPTSGAVWPRTNYRKTP